MTFLSLGTLNDLLRAILLLLGCFEFSNLHQYTLTGGCVLGLGHGHD